MKFETGQTSSNNFQQVATTRSNYAVAMVTCDVEISLSQSFGIFWCQFDYLVTSAEGGFKCR